MLHLQGTNRVISLFWMHVYSNSLAFSSTFHKIYIFLICRSITDSCIFVWVFFCTKLYASYLFNIKTISFYAPDQMVGAYCYCPVCLFVCLFVCLSVVVNFNLRYNFWTIRDRDFIFGMHTPLMTRFQMTPRSMTFWPPFWTCCRQGHSFSHTHLDFLKK